jgi:hypothetical protein
MWPDISYELWRETCSALHLYAQIVGKYRLGGVEVAFDLHDHAVIGTTTEGRRAGFPLDQISVAEFHARFLDLIADLGGTPQFDGSPNEVPNPVPFSR